MQNTFSEQLLDLIKQRASIRRYQDKPVPKEILDKIIEAGIWGPSLMAPGFQPWKFVVIQDAGKIKKLSEIMFVKSKQLGAGANVITRISAETIASAKVLVVIYNCSAVVSFVKRINEDYMKMARQAEIAAISAVIQNMILVAEGFGLGSCWLDTPLFCKDGINEFVKPEGELVAMLTLGYPAEKGKRCKRKPLSESVIYE
ncbi:MAG: nitroreductase family protein [Candidatus Omnitrophica bacterium]|jgi:nitroreductase|nr:nitroreductase family protein [Candidatus Omnitrophota bacterium]